MYMLVMSKPVFTMAQNAALRKTLAKLARTYPSETKVAEDLGIAQQNVNRLLKHQSAGFAYSTAIALVRLAGHEGLDAFFSDREVADATRKKEVTP